MLSSNGGLIVLFLLTSDCLDAQKFVPEFQTSSLLEGGKEKAVLKSPVCKQVPPLLRFEVVVNKEGHIIQAKAVRDTVVYTHERAGLIKRALREARNLVLNWKYKPFEDGGKVKEIKTNLSVPCLFE